MGADRPPALTRRAVLERELRRLERLARPFDEPAGFWASIQAIGLECPTPHELRALRVLFEAYVARLPVGEHAIRAADVSASKEEIARLELELADLKKLDQPGSSGLETSKMVGTELPGTVMEIAGFARRRRRWSVADSRAAGDAAHLDAHVPAAASPSAVDGNELREESIDAGARTEQMQLLKTHRGDALLDRCDAVLQGHRVTGEAMAGQVDAEAPQELAPLVELRECLRALLHEHRELLAGSTSTATPEVPSPDVLNQAMERETLAEEVLILVHALQKGAAQRASAERERAVRDAVAKAVASANEQAVAREDEWREDKLRVAVKQAMEGAAGGEAVSMLQEQALIEAIAGDDDASSISAAIRLAAQTPSAVAGGASAAVAVAARRVIALLRSASPPEAIGPLLWVLARLVKRHVAAAEAVLDEGALPLLLSTSVASETPKEAAPAASALAAVVQAAPSSALRDALSSGHEAAISVEELLQELRRRIAQIEINEASEESAKAVAAVVRAMPTAAATAQPAVRELATRLAQSNHPAFASALATLDPSAATTARVMAESQGLPRLVVLLDSRTPAGTLAGTAMQLDLLLRGDDASHVLASLNELHGATKLLATLRHGRSDQPTSLRDLPPTRTIVPLLGVLESAASASDSLRAEALRAGGVATLVAMLRVLLESEREAFDGRKHSAIKDSELLPNLLLALGALVRNNEEGVSSLRAEGGMELLDLLLQTYPMSESAILAMQLLVDAGARPRIRARALDNAAINLGARQSMQAAQITAMLMLDKLAQRLTRRTGLEG